MSETRLDGNGGRWTLAEVEQEMAAIVSRLDPKAGALPLARSTRFARDLGWDEWFRLGLSDPVARKLHVVLPAATLLRDVRSFGDLIDAVWARLEVAP